MASGRNKTYTVCLSIRKTREKEAAWKLKHSSTALCAFSRSKKIADSYALCRCEIQTFGALLPLQYLPACRSHCKSASLTNQSDTQAKTFMHSSGPAHATARSVHQKKPKHASKAKQKREKRTRYSLIFGQEFADHNVTRPINNRTEKSWEREIKPHAENKEKRNWKTKNLYRSRKFV